MGVAQNTQFQNFDIPSDTNSQIKKQIINSLCKIYINDQYKGIGFLCKILTVNSSTYNIPVLITYNHIIKKQNIINNDNITISVNNEDLYTINLNSYKSIYTNIELDITIIELNNNEDINFLYIDINESLNNLYESKLAYLLESVNLNEIEIFNGRVKKIINNIIVYYESRFHLLVSNKGLILNLENNKIIGLLNNKNNELEREHRGILLTTPIKNFISIYEDKQKNNRYLKSYKSYTYQRPKTLSSSYIHNNNINNLNLYNNYYLYNQIPYYNLYHRPTLNSFNQYQSRDIFVNNYQQNAYLQDSESTHSSLLTSPNFSPQNNFNYIELLLEINENDLNKKIFFLDNTDFEDENGVKHFHDNLKELSELNTQLYINNQQLKYQKFYIFNNVGKYNVKLQFSNPINNCGFMFYDCINITEIDLSHFNSKNVINMEYMFYYCEKLTNINLSNFNTSNVTNMNCMFYRCNNLNKINLKSFDTKKVINMSYMFSHCKNITLLNLESFNTSNTSNMGYMFYECKNLLKLDLSSFNTQNVTNMSHMFMRCSSLQNLNVINFNTKNVLDMSYMFHDCKSLNELNLSSFDFTDNNDMDHMFYYCKNLKVIYINNNSYKKLKKYKDDSTYESKFDIKVIK